MKRLTIAHVCVVTLGATFLLLAFDRAGHLRGKQPTWTPPPTVQPQAAAAAPTDAGKPPPHNDKIEDLPEHAVVKSYGGVVKILSLVAGRSSTNVIAKICRAYPNGVDPDSK